jgi:hypothetical protein
VKIKALSFRQPWATLILEGHKTMDLRTWSTHYRGALAIYASLEVEKDACKLHGVDVKTLTTGALIGIVDLVDVIPLTKKVYDANQERHLAGRHYREGLYGWVVANPRPLDPPQIVRGRLNLFDVNIEQAEEINSAPIHAPTFKTSPVKNGNETYSVPSEFELRVVPVGDNQYRLAFTQNLVEAVPDQLFLYHFPVPKARVEVELSGDTLKAIADHVIETLRQNGYKPTDLKASRREPFLLNEETGVRLGLIFLAVRRISKSSRIEAISHGIRQMTSEELYYWYSKCTGGPTPERAQKALRIFLADE